MISVGEAFEKFRSRLELTEKEQTDASSRQIELREVMNGAFAIAEATISRRQFLSGLTAKSRLTARPRSGCRAAW